MDADEFRNTLLEVLEKKTPEVRAAAFASCFTNEALRLTMAEGSASASMTVMLMSLIHTCNRHPEWVRAVVEDSKWITADGTEKETEDALLEIVNWYPLPRRVYANTRD